jgi:hypothetical protein
MYIKYKDFNGTLNEGDVLLMSASEWLSNKDIKGVPICITPDGEEPIEVEKELEK